ncbi:MAG: 2-hydroxyglutaryl-CoA dehydratase [Anaerolineales bacterium]|nr:2-hydroxyglutaryl-CoA dehydratase [Anaerolineales bacterium]
MAYIAGLDLGAGGVKTVIIDEQRNLLGRASLRTQADFDAVGRRCIAAACEQAGLRPADIEYIASTGLGRYSFADRNIQITDLTCGARGAHALFPEARFVLDMGAQSTRAVALRDGGRVKSFRTNEKCAAGSGGFLERVARYLEVPLHELGTISMEAKDPQPISSVCAVLAESEIINHVSEGRTVADIVRGAHESLAARAFSQLKLVGFDDSVVFIGGVAVQEGMVAACRARFGGCVFIPEHPAHVVALGAALLGLQRFEKRNLTSAPGGVDASGSTGLVSFFNHGRQMGSL